MSAFVYFSTDIAEFKPNYDNTPTAKVHKHKNIEMVWARD